MKVFKKEEELVKKMVLVALAALLFGTAHASAAVGDDKIVGVNFDLIGVLFDVFSGSAEVKLPLPKTTVKGDVTWSPNYSWVTNVSGLDLSATVRYYYGSLLPFDFPDSLKFLKGGPLEGLYVGGGASVHSWGWSYGGYSWSYFAPGIVLETGAKYFPQNAWSWWPANVYAEGGLVVNLNLPAKWKDSNGNEFSGTEPTTPGAASFNVDLGYAF